ncbi:unnamed protein product, partial [Allacma fusca]
MKVGLTPEIVTDGGTHFTGKEFEDFLKVHHINHIIVPPYSPQSNGVVERSNRGHKNTIRKYLNDNKTNWDLLCDQVAFTHNTHHHRGLDNSPFFLVHGRNPITRADLVTPLIQEPPRLIEKEQQDQLDAIEKAVNLTKKQQDASNEKANLGRREHSYKIDEYVVINTMQGGLNTRWSKPFKIIEGGPLRIAAPLEKRNMQERMRIYREKRIFNFMPVMISETAQILNATPTVVPVNVEKGFGKQLPDGTWDSYIGKIMDDTVHMTLPFTPSEYQFARVIFSKVVTSSPYVFLAPLPKTQEVNLEFLWKPLDTLTWLAIFLCIVVFVVNAIVIYALVSCTPSLSKQFQPRKWSTMKHIQFVTSNMGSFLRVLNDQSFPENMLKQDGTSSGVRIVVLFWLVAMIVITTLYKSVVISKLVEPIYIKPPLTFDELLQSDFQVNIILYKALHFENRFPKLKILKRPVKDRVVDIYGCLKTLVEVSKETFFFPSSFAISHKNPKLKRVLDRIVDVFIEGSLDSHWVDMD